MTGVLGRRETFVPLAAARIDSNRLVVEASKEQVACAPQVDEGRHISSQDEAEIYRYYGFSIDPAEHTGTSADPGVDDAMTRSEEHLVVGTRQSEATRVRLRK